MKAILGRSEKFIAIVRKSDCSIIDKVDISAYNDEYIQSLLKTKRKEYPSKSFKVIKV